MGFNIHGKKRYKPLYKKFNQVFENVQLRQKLLSFKKQKWKNLINRLKKANYYRKKYRKYKIFNHSGNSLVRLGSYRKSPQFKKNYKYLMKTTKKFKLFYGGFKKRYIRKQIHTLLSKKKIKKVKNKVLGNTNHSFLDFMEKRLETVLHRTFFTQSIKTARQLILHGYVFVNNRVIKHGSYILKKNDKITINSKLHTFILLNIKNSKCWPVQLSNLLINYKTLQIVYFDRYTSDNFINLFPFRIKTRDVIKHFKYH
jgi:ribosomal protein S4